MKTQQKIMIAAAALGCLLVGCSPTGWSVKQPPDRSNLQPGTQVVLHERSGATITGIYLGTASGPSRDYIERYTATADASLLPGIGEHVTMTTVVTGEKVWDGEFLGFDEGHLWVMKNGDPIELYVSSLSRLNDSRGHELQRLSLRSMYLNRGNPPHDEPHDSRWRADVSRSAQRC